MAILGDLVVNLGINRRSMTGGLAGARSDLAGFASKAIGILAPIGASLTAAFGIEQSINAAREAIASEKKLAAVLAATGGAAGLSADQIREYASELQAVTNFGDEATISAAAVLATFKEIKGDQFKEALAVAQDLSAVLGQDVQSSVVQIGKALNDPIKGVTALRRVGVSFNQTQLETIKRLQEQGDLLGAQRVILDELQSEFGGAAQAMADPLTQAKNLLGDISEAIGFAILPPLNEMTGSLRNSNEEIGTFTTRAKTLGVVLADIVTQIQSGEGALGRFGQRWASIVDTIKKFDPTQIALSALGDFLDKKAAADQAAGPEAVIPGFGNQGEAGALEEFDDTKALDDAIKKLRDINNEIELLSAPDSMKGMLEINQQLEKFKDAGAPEGMVDQLRIALQEQQRLKAAEEDKQRAEQDAESKRREMQGEADRLIEESRTPLQKFEDEIARLQELRDQGFIGDKTLAFGKEQAQKALDDATKSDSLTSEPRIAGGAVRGSQEALERILRAGARQKDPALKVQRDALTEQKATRKAVESLVKNPPVFASGVI